jgi:hypothetical protein
MTYQYSSAEHDAFGWNTLHASMPLAESHGLDYESARAATPRWFGVSSGNGNDGVSHMFPDYFVRCLPDEAWDLARAAMISDFKPGEGQAFACENMETDGEADYMISATILNPPDDDGEPETPDYEDIAESNGFILAPYPEGFAWCKNGICDIAAYYKSEAEAWQACCESNDLIPDDDGDDSEMWCNVNGAWLIIEVFPTDDEFDPDHCRSPVYDSLAACFSDDILKLAAE